MRPSGTVPSAESFHTLILDISLSLLSSSLSPAMYLSLCPPSPSFSISTPSPSPCVFNQFRFSLYLSPSLCLSLSAFPLCLSIQIHSLSSRCEVVGVNLMDMSHYIHEYTQYTLLWTQTINSFIAKHLNPCFSSLFLPLSLSSR